LNQLVRARWQLDAPRCHQHEIAAALKVNQRCVHDTLLSRETAHKKFLAVGKAIRRSDEQPFKKLSPI